MRVLAITYLYPPLFIGGAEIECKAIIDNLTLYGHEIYVLTSSYGVNEPCSEKNVFRVYDTLFTAPFPDNQILRFFSAKNERLTKDYISRVKPDIILVFNLFTLGQYSILNAIKQSKVPYGVHLSGMQMLGPFVGWLLHSKGFESPIYQVIGKLSQFITFHLLTPKHYKNALTVGLSNVVNNQFIKAGYDAKNFRVIYNQCIDPQKYNFIHRFHQKGTLKLLYVGRVERLKGIPTLMESMEYLKKNGLMEGISLGIVGDGESAFVEEWKRRLASVGLSQQVEFLGKKTYNEIFDIHRLYDTLIFPSWLEEVSGGAFLEAMLLGTPVVASNYGGPSEFIEHGKTGLLFPVKDASALAECIIRLRDNPDLRVKLGRDARLAVEEMFNQERNSSAFDLFLKDVRNSNLY